MRLVGRLLISYQHVKLGPLPWTDIPCSRLLPVQPSRRRPSSPVSAGGVLVDHRAIVAGHRLDDAGEREAGVLVGLEVLEAFQPRLPVRPELGCAPELDGLHLTFGPGQEPHGGGREALRRALARRSWGTGHDRFDQGLRASRHRRRRRSSKAYRRGRVRRLAGTRWLALAGRANRSVRAGRSGPGRLSGGVYGTVSRPTRHESRRLWADLEVDVGLTGRNGQINVGLVGFGHR